uniref:E3 SUMO-protein ligase NSE2 n=1 Tax=Glossina brevipalpis TaxID=37001 RepID=A0A1A9X4V9_9MUSC
MDAQLEAELDNARECLLDTFDMALTYGDTDSQEAQTFLNLVTRMCEIKYDAIRNAKAAEAAKEARTLAEFEDNYKRALEEQAEFFDAKKTKEYKNFVARFKQMEKEHSASADAASSSNANDDMMIEGEICIKDPLTKMTMQNPVKNRKCGHRYEKSSIMNHIEGKNQPCPVAGCPNKQFITKKDLVDDILFKIQIQKIAEQED